MTQHQENSDPAGSTAMFRAFVKRADIEDGNRTGRPVLPLVLIAVVVVLAVVAVGFGAMLLLG